MTKRLSIGRGYVRRPLRPGASILLAVIAMAAATAAFGQVPPVHRVQPNRRIFNPQRPRRAVESPEVAVNRQQAVQVISLYLRQGVKQPHVGEQTTHLYQGMLSDARQLVKYAGPGRVRMEYISPDHLKGEIILISGGRFFLYKPGPQPKILEGVATPEEFQGRIRAVLKGINNRTIQVRTVGEELIAGQRAAIVEIHSAGGFYLKFWIDETTGVRLKYQNLDAAGRAVSETYFTSIDYEAKTEPADFNPALLPNVPHEPLLPEGPPLATVQEAQQRVGYTIKQPAIPTGFHMNGVWVVNSAGRNVVIMRYTDDVNTYALFQSPQGKPGAAPLKTVVQVVKQMRLRNVGHWLADGIGLPIVGNLKPENVRMIVESTQ